jgi:hypothetical protein
MLKEWIGVEYKKRLLDMKMSGRISRVQSTHMMDRPS